MKLKRMMSLLMCFAMLASVGFNNPQNLLTVQAAEIIGEAEEESQYEVEIEEAERGTQEETKELDEDTESQDTEEIIENESEDIQQVEESNDIYVEEEEIQERDEMIEDENSYARIASIAINSTNFPDSVFREYVKENFDSNGDNALSESERNAVTGIDVNYYSIKNIQGIEFFSNLESLKCYNSSLTSIDVSKNTKLTSLNCESNNLTSIDVSKNAALTELNCSSNNLTSIDVSKNAALTSLECDFNDLTSIDISKNTALSSLYCWDNNLTSIDVSKNTALTSLNCSYNNLTSIDVSKNTKLAGLSFYGNNLTSIDISKNTALIDLGCSYNNLKSLNISKNTKLKWMWCAYNDLKSLDVSKNTELTELFCGNNKLTSLTGVQNLTKLYNLYVANNLLTVLPDMTKLTELGSYFDGVRYVSFQNNYLSGSELKSKLPSHLLKQTDWLKIQIDSQYQKTAIPTNLTSTIASTSSIKLNWAKAAEADGYRVYISTKKDSGYTALGNTAGTSYTCKSLNPGTTYYFKIRSYKTVSGKKIYSSYTLVISKKLTVPTPKNVKVSNSSATSLKISWSKVSGATGYQIYRADKKTGTYKNIKTITSETTTSYTDKKLKNGKSYYYKIRAYKTVSGSKKYSSFSNVLSKKVALSKPTVTAKVKNSSSISLSWKKVSGAAKYEIYRATSQNGKYTKIKTVTGTTYTNSKLKTNKTYYYKVKAVQSSYKSAYSTVKSAKTSK